MAANSEESLEERTMGEELLETKGPVAPRGLTVEDGSEDENENSGDILDEQDDEERNPLLELKKCKDWLQQQKINHEAELLVRKLLTLTLEWIVMNKESCNSEKPVKIVQLVFLTRRFLWWVINCFCPPICCLFVIQDAFSNVRTYSPHLVNHHNQTFMKGMCTVIMYVYKV